MKPVRINYNVMIESFSTEETALRAGLPGFKVKGTAINECISRNGWRYTSEELKKAAPSLIGRPILKDHKNTTDNIVGKVTTAVYIPESKSISFEGVIVDERTTALIKLGMLDHVSVGATVKGYKEEMVDDQKVQNAEGIEFLELSVTPVPGIPSASISAGESMALAITEALKDETYNEVGNDVLITVSKSTHENNETHTTASTVSIKKEEIEEKKKTKEDEKMNQEQDIAKEALIDVIVGQNKGYTREELAKCNAESLRVILNQKQKALPKGVTVTEEVQEYVVSSNEENTNILLRQGDIKAGTYVGEKLGDRVVIWKMPSYKR